MALLFLDGFDHLGTTDPVTLGKWGSLVSTLAPSTVLPRTGTHALQLTNVASQVVSKALPASGGGIVGLAINLTAFATTTDLVQLREGTTVHLAVAVTTGGQLVVKRGSTPLVTGSTVLSLNAWYYLEFKGVIDDAAGAYELRIDTVPEVSASGVDTRNGGTTGQWDRIALGATGNPTYVDDVYVCDTSGAAPRNTFLGPCKVETLYPQTDAIAAGSNAGLTPSTGTDHGALVDEPAPNTTDYNGSATVGAKDTYQYPSLALTGPILGVQTNLYCAKSDTGARQVCAVVRAGGIDYDGANVAPQTSFSYFSEVRAQNPNTSADWTTSDVASLQAGMKVTV